MRRLATAALVSALVALPTACASGQQQGSQSTAEPGPGQVKCSYPVNGSPARAVDPPDAITANSGTVTAVLHLSAGDVTISMDRANAPCAVNSFVSLAQQGYFDNTVCHRLTDQGIFVLQCGDPSGSGKGGPGYSFADELTGKESYVTGTVAMANAGPDTNGSQFFLVYADSTQLEPKYTVLGHMDTKAVQVVGSIAAEGVAADGKTPNAKAEITSVSLG